MRSSPTRVTTSMRPSSAGWWAMRSRYCPNIGRAAGARNSARLLPTISSGAYPRRSAAARLTDRRTPARSWMQISPRPDSPSSREGHSVRPTTRDKVDMLGGREGPLHRPEQIGHPERLGQHRHPAVAEELVVFLGFGVDGEENEAPPRPRPAARHVLR